MKITTCEQNIVPCGQEVYHEIHTKEEKLNIGRRIYEGELTRYQAAEEYDIGENTARSYMRMYRDLNQLPPKEKGYTAPLSTGKPSGLSTSQNLEAYKAMTKKKN